LNGGGSTVTGARKTSGIIRASGGWKCGGRKSETQMPSGHQTRVWQNVVPHEHKQPLRGPKLSGGEVNTNGGNLLGKKKETGNQKLERVDIFHGHARQISEGSSKAKIEGEGGSRGFCKNTNKELEKELPKK